MRKQVLLLIFNCFLLLGLALAQVSAATSSKASFDNLVDQYFDFYFQFHPSEGTLAGLHSNDSRLEDFSASAINGEAAGLKRFLGEFRGVDKAKLPEESAGDLGFLEGRIRARLLELEQIRMWKKDPDLYADTVSNSVFLLMARNFAPIEERLRSIIAREKEIPKVLHEARSNLSNPPRVYTEVALEQLPGTTDFFKNDVPKAFSAVQDAGLLREFKASNQAAVAALQEYEKFVREQLLPKSNGDFRIGEENFRKKLLYEDMVDIPLDRLLEIGYADLRRNQQLLKDTAERIDPKRTPAQVLDDLQTDHPTADQLLQSVRDVLGGLRKFVEEKKIITIPSSDPILVEETPVFQRALTTASLEMPGIYETKDTTAIFDVTPPEADWKPDHVEDWLKSFNRADIVGTAIHEAYPGHYVQYVWQRHFTSKTRKLLYCNTNAEGWAHYAEQMMLDEGYGNSDAKLRLSQVVEALLRDARFIVGIQMHTGHMTLEQARQFFVDEGHQTSATADAEAKRGTSDPTYLVYTLGKLQILKLRDDYEKMKGEKFSLEEFHNRFMGQGGMPMKIIRKAMLGDDSPAL